MSEEIRKYGKVNPLQNEINGLTAQILALVDEKATLEEQKKERAGGVMRTPQNSLSLSDPMPRFSPLVPLSNVVGELCHSRGVGNCATRNARSGGRRRWGWRSGAPRREAMRKTRERRQRVKETSFSKAESREV